MKLRNPAATPSVAGGVPRLFALELDLGVVVVGGGLPATTPGALGVRSQRCRHPVFDDWPPKSRIPPLTPRPCVQKCAPSVTVDRHTARVITRTAAGQTAPLAPPPGQWNPVIRPGPGRHHLLASLLPQPQWSTWAAVDSVPSPSLPPRTQCTGRALPKECTVPGAGPTTVGRSPTPKRY